MEVRVSKILYLDKDYHPCGTRVIRRPGINYPNSREDSDRIMAAGIDAFLDHEFENEPVYWVTYKGDINDPRDLHINNRYALERMINYHFCFISLHEIERKINRIGYLLDFRQKYPVKAFLVHPDGITKKNQVIVSLCGGDDDIMKFSLGDFLCSLRDGIEECTTAMKTVREQIKDRNNDANFINDTMYLFKSLCRHNSVPIGKDNYVDYNKFRKLLLSPSYNNMMKTIHDLKKRLKELERQRGYMQYVMDTIMSSTWQAD